MMPPTNQAPAASITYQATALDTVPGIASRFYAQTGYGSFSQLIADIMTVNPQVSDFTASLDGVTLLIPTTGG